MNFLYIDTEYHNFFSYDRSKSGEILSMGLSCEGHEFETTMRPVSMDLWSKQAQGTHGFTKYQAQHFPAPFTVAISLQAFLEKLPAVYTPVGFNCKGDKGLLLRFCQDFGLTEEWGKHVRDEWIDLYDLVGKLPTKDRRLETVCKYYQIEAKFHKALEDARATRLLHENLMAEADAESKQHSMEFKDKWSKRLHYLSDSYITLINDRITIERKATQDKEAMRIILEELAERYYLN